MAHFGEKEMSECKEMKEKLNKRFPVLVCSQKHLDIIENYAKDFGVNQSEAIRRLIESGAESTRKNSWEFWK